MNHDATLPIVNVSAEAAALLRANGWERHDLVTGLLLRLASTVPPPFQVWYGLEHLATVVTDTRVVYSVDPDAWKTAPIIGIRSDL